MWIFVLSLILVTTVYCDELQYCPPNLQRSTHLKTYNGHCYEFMIHRHVEWNVAENDCSSKGGTLAVVNNIEEQFFIMSALRSFPFHGQGVWIGLSDTQQEGKFTWINGEASSFTYWAPGQPGVVDLPSIGGRKRLILDTLTGGGLHLPHLIDEDCVLLKYSDSGHWHDYPCVKLDPLGLVHENYPYVCEYNQTPVPTSTTLGTPMRPSTPSTTTLGGPISVTTPEPDIAGTTTSGAIVGSVGELVIG
ncbi:collectin-12-like [Saccostrea echinata]|uniref:collectin-12-like n=1 Tax=Saccostrea echinata TaxID=191078 RepID=UPI002A7FD7B0|nr:collectin-12-like [Saccostrea echinata]